MGGLFFIFFLLIDLVVVFDVAYNDAAELAQAGTGRNEVAADDVLLHALEVVRLAGDGGFVEDLGGFLERGGGHEALGLEGGTGDSLEDTGGGGGLGIAHLDEAQVAALEA